MKQLARTDAALPLGPNTFYEGDEVVHFPLSYPLSFFLLSLKYDDFGI
jgi:hypothetical protein